MKRHLRHIWLGKAIDRDELAVLTGDDLAGSHAWAVTQLYLPWWAGLRPYVFELAAAGAWLLTGISNLLDPAQLEHSPVGHNVVPYAPIWSVFYVLGSVGIVFGILRPAPAVRVASLVLLATGLVMQTIAAVSF